MVLILLSHSKKEILFPKTLSYSFKHQATCRAAVLCRVHSPILSLCNKNPGMALSVPQSCCCSMAASLSPPESFQGEIAMLELISEPRTKSRSVASYWLSVRRDSAPSTLTTKPTKHDPLPFNGRPVYANALSSCLSLSFSLETQ